MTTSGEKLRRLGLCLSILCTVQQVGARIFDGPYVRYTQGGGLVSEWAVPSDQGLGKKSVPVEIGDAVVISKVDARPSFQVVIRRSNEWAPVGAPNGNPIFVMADTHGEYEICTELLMKQGVISDSLEWKFGKGHLIILGDVFDRGSRQTEIIWLIYKLEAEAAAAGGRVHFLLGNHESMVLTGDVRYLHTRYYQTASALGVTSYQELFSKDTLLGQWLRTKATVLKLGNTLYLHGGISIGAVDQNYTLDEINTAVLSWLNDDRSKDSGRLSFITNNNGPLWYRGLVKQDAKPEEVEAIKKFYGVARIAVGHTVVDTVTPSYNGSVIAVQVYPKQDPNTGRMKMEGVFIDENSIWHKAMVDGTREILRDDAGNPIKNGVIPPAADTKANTMPTVEEKAEAPASKKAA
ncbi:metallophosphoesterase [Oleiharenicola lentus]|uniref:metallophosphoesterase n=1 Tax=Oleiharenicola lentus TaxID=2508720 RepID=UPI003F67212C